ncbi:unnamed protein product [Prunus armeniaca]
MSRELFTAIEGSRFADIVLSQNYASSTTWCLNELLHLLKFMGAREAVLPIFYDVDPSHVRKQTRSSNSDDKTNVQEWRFALAKMADFSRWNAKNWYTLTSIIFPRKVRNFLGFVYV